jgi:hypothetical protein
VRCKGDFNFNNFSQKAIVKYNLSRLNTSQSYQSIKSSIEAGVRNALNSDTTVKKGALSLAADVGITNESQAINKTANIIANSYDFSTFSNDVIRLDQSQVQNIKNVISDTGDCNLNNISQTIVLDVMIKQITQTISSNVATLLNNSQTFQSTETKTDYTQTGVLQDFFNGLSNIFSSISGFFWIILIIVFAAIFGLGYLIYGLIFSEDSPKVTEEQTSQ